MSHMSLLPQARIDALIAAHATRRKPMFRVPHELLFPGNEPEEEQRTALKEEAKKITPAVWTCIGMNSLTEVNLPYYHDLLSSTSGLSWEAWARQWTSEEKRHDDVLHDLIRISGVIKVRELERMQFDLMYRGFKPRWHGLGELFVFWYTVFQEDLTTISYYNLVKLLNRLGANRIAKMMGYIAGEEGAHRTFYQGAMDELAPIDPDSSLVALQEVLSQFTMPGKNISGFHRLTLIAERAGMLGGADFLKIAENAFTRYKVAAMQPVRDEGKRAQEWLMGHLKDLHSRIQERTSDRKKRAFRVPFLADAVVV